MQKQLSIVAASLLITTKASAILFQPGSNMIVGFNAAGMGSYFIDTGISADDYINAPNIRISLDVSAASAALGGTIESYILLGYTAGATPPPQGDSFGYIDSNAGLVYAQPGLVYAKQRCRGALTPSCQTNYIQSNTVLENTLTELEGFFVGANFGQNPEGSVGDLDGSGSEIPGIGFEYLFVDPQERIHIEDAGDTSALAVHVSQDNNFGISASTSFEIRPGLAIGSGWCDEGGADVYSSREQCLEIVYWNGVDVRLVGDTLDLHGFQDSTFTAVPTPGTAWLFGSALLSFASLKKRQVSSAQSKVKECAQPRSLDL